MATGGGDASLTVWKGEARALLESRVALRCAVCNVWGLLELNWG